MTDTTISGSPAGQSARAAAHVAAPQPAPPPKSDKAAVPSAPPPEQRQPLSSGVGALGAADSATAATPQPVSTKRQQAIQKWVNGDPTPAADAIYNALKAGSIPNTGIDRLSPADKQALIACALDQLDANLTSSLAALVKEDKDQENLRDVVTHASLRGLVAQGLAQKAGELLVSPPQSMARFDANYKAYRLAEAALEVMRGHDDQLSKLMGPELGMCFISAVRRDHLKVPAQPLHLSTTNYWPPRDTSELLEQILSALNRAPYTPENRALVNELCAQITPSDVAGCRGLAEKLAQALVRDPDIAKLGAPETPALKEARLTEIFFTKSGAKAAFGGSPIGNAYMIIAMCNQPAFTAVVALVSGDNVTRNPLLVEDIAKFMADVYTPANRTHEDVAKQFAAILASKNQKLFFNSFGHNGAELSLSRLNASSNLKEAATIIANNPNLTAEKFSAYNDPCTEPDFAKAIAQKRAREFFKTPLRDHTDYVNLACRVMGIPPNEATDPANAAKIKRFLSKLNGKEVTPIPYTFINEQRGAVTYACVLLKDKYNHYHWLNKELEEFDDFDSCLKNAKLPAGRVVFPTDGFYTSIDGGNFDLNSRMTPASAKEGLDFSSLAGGVLACGLMIVANLATGGFAVVAGVIAGGYGAISSGINFYELGKNGELASAQGAEAALNLAAIALGLGGIAKGSRVLLRGAFVANGAAIGADVLDFALNAGDMKKGQIAERLFFLFVTGGVMGLARVRVSKTPPRPIKVTPPPGYTPWNIFMGADNTGVTSGAPASNGTPPIVRILLAEPKNQTPGGSGAPANAPGDHTAPASQRPPTRAPAKSKPPAMEAAGKKGGGKDGRRITPAASGTAQIRQRVKKAISAINNQIKALERLAKNNRIEGRADDNDVIMILIQKAIKARVALETSGNENALNAARSVIADIGLLTDGTFSPTQMKGYLTGPLPSDDDAMRVLARAIAKLEPEEREAAVKPSSDTNTIIVDDRTTVDDRTPIEGRFGKNVRIIREKYGPKIKEVQQKIEDCQDKIDQAIADVESDSFQGKNKQEYMEELVKERERLLEYKKTLQEKMSREIHDALREGAHEDEKVDDDIN